MDDLNFNNLNLHDVNKQQRLPMQLRNSKTVSRNTPNKRKYTKKQNKITQVLDTNNSSETLPDVSSTLTSIECSLPTTSTKLVSNELFSGESDGDSEYVSDNDSDNNSLFIPTEDEEEASEEISEDEADEYDEDELNKSLENVELLETIPTRKNGIKCCDFITLLIAKVIMVESVGNVIETNQQKQE